MPRSVRLDDLLPYLMNRLVARLNQNLGERLRRRGYSFQEWRVLAVLAAHDGITLSQLADATVMPQPTVSRVVARLERRQFLRRRPGAGDSRFVEAWITRRGAAAYRKMLPLAVGEYRRAVAGFDAKQTQWLRRAAIQMIENIGVELLPERPPQGIPPRLGRGLFGHLRFGQPHREHPGYPEEKEIKRQKHDQAHMRPPFVLDEQAKEIGDEVAGHHEYQIVDQKGHNCLRQRPASGSQS